MALKKLFCFMRISPAFVVMNTIIWMIDIAIIIFCIVQGFKYIYTNSKLQPFHKRSYWLCLLSFGLLSMVIALSGFTCHTDNDIAIAIITFSILLLSFSCQISVLYQLIGRVYYTFKGSSYEISEKQFFILKLHCFIIFLCGCLSFIFLIIDEFESSEPIQPLEWKLFCGLLLGSSIFYYWVISWRCVYLFASKILKITVSTMNSVTDITQINTISINSKQKKFLDTITKHVVLSSIRLTLTIISAIIIINMAIFMLLTTLNTTKTEDERLKIARIGLAVFITVAIVDVGITVATMYMHYQFGNKVYLRLCNHCHYCFSKLLHKKTGNKMTQRAIDLHSRTGRIGSVSCDTITKHTKNTQTYEEDI